ncbi:hypothetical protein B5S33_g1736 [[Candida] boidinii]|nr:hypothetical protein B5S33_g1736 [[Candida] boidinii]
MSTIKTSAFVKKLASNNRVTREAAFESLQKYLATRSTSRKLSLLEYEKLWKGLYYTMWFSDRPRPQQRIANLLASLFSETIPADNFSMFVKAFWEIVAKEWPEIDQWRVDKFLMMMRYVVRECFKKLQDNEWSLELTEDYLNILSEGILSGNIKYPAGVVYHIIDVYIDELERVVFGDQEEEDEEEEAEDEKDDEEIDAKKQKKLQETAEIIKDVPVMTLLGPFIRLRKEALSKPLKKKIVEEIFEDERLANWGIPNPDIAIQKELKKSRKQKPKKEEDEEEEDDDDDEEEENDEEEEEDEDEEEEDEEEEEEEEWNGFGN